MQGAECCNTASPDNLEGQKPAPPRVSYLKDLRAQRDESAARLDLMNRAIAELENNPDVSEAIDALLNHAQPGGLRRIY